jgi:hypothetical protein
MFDRIIEVKLILRDGKQKYLGALTDLCGLISEPV